MMAPVIKMKDKTGKGGRMIAAWRRQFKVPSFGCQLIDACRQPVVGQRSQERQVFPCCRMAKLQAASVQGDQPLPLVGAPGSEGPSAAVHFVTQQRMAAAGALDADLMGATGFELDFEQRLVRQLLNHAVMKNGDSRRRIGAVSDNRSRF